MRQRLSELHAQDGKPHQKLWRGLLPPAREYHAPAADIAASRLLRNASFLPAEDRLLTRAVKKFALRQDTGEPYFDKVIRGYLPTKSKLSLEARFRELTARSTPENELKRDVSNMRMFLQYCKDVAKNWTMQQDKALAIGVKQDHNK